MKSFPSATSQIIPSSNQANKKNIFALLLFACIYIDLSILSLVFVYKYISIGSYVIGISAIIMPIWYALGDAIAELFGYNIARNIIWVNVICCLFFSIVTTLGTDIHAAPNWHHQSAYNYIFGSILRVGVAGEVSVVFGAFINAFCISKWKIMCKGKYFWLRSIASSFIGVTFQIFIAGFLIYFRVMSFDKLMMLILLSLAIQICISLIVVWPNSFLVMILKKFIPNPNSEVINWNPFSTT